MVKIATANRVRASMERRDEEGAESVSINVIGATTGAVTKPASCKKQKPGEISSRPVYVSCPICHVGYKCHFETDIVDGVADGIARVLMTPPCGHKFVIFVDCNLRARAIERVDHEGVVCEHADTIFLENHIRALEEKHHQLARAENSYNEAFELMQQIKKAKKELEALKSKIVVK
ncbi:MAG: hypothetical protein GYA24_01620 [Candidatus Lokiarchaeota archaeon]|nr:hypothetical protein [Candidatus Lokiarchaeota archaeon]